MPPKHKYQHVKDVLKRRIRSFPVGAKVSSTAKLHKELGVSPQTINRAISDLVDEGILERLPRRGTFVSQPSKSTPDIGFIWPAAPERLAKHPYAGTILHGAQTEASKRKRHLLVASNVDATHPAFTGEDRVAGVLVLFNHDRHLVEAYIARGVPVVLIVPLVRPEGVPFVTSDHYLGMFGATMHLVKLGHRRIVHVTLDISECIPVEEKAHGYHAAMREAELDEMAYVHRVPAEPWTTAYDAVLIDMFRAVEATACCCFDDDVAAAVIRICHERGIRVPDELSVVGYDDSSVVSHTWPAVTTVHVPLDEMGRTAVRLLNELVETDRLTGCGIVLPTRLVERASTKPPLSRDSVATSVEDLSAGGAAERAVL